jgi:hypothetical protein
LRLAAGTQGGCEPFALRVTAVDASPGGRVRYGATMLPCPTEACALPAGELKPVTQLPEINFYQIRGKAPSGSRRDGFEELSSQLMIYGSLVEWPSGTDWTVFGNPDGGREGRGELPSGDVWCWQAKYLFELGSDEFGQIDKSVRRAISTEPNLSRYFVILPYNRPGGDTVDSQSAWTKWKRYVAQWEAAAAEAGRTVGFVYIGETQLSECLLQPSQVGRLRYWFDLDGFSDERFHAIAVRAEADAGGRYTAGLNVELPIAGVFDGLARTVAFAYQIRTRRASLREPRGRYGLSVPSERPDLFRPAIARVDECLDCLDSSLGLGAEQAEQVDGELPDLQPSITAAIESLDEVSALLRDHCSRDGYYVDNAGSLHHQVGQIRSAVSGLRDLTQSRAWRSFAERAVLITGTGGTGKTHLLCDLALKRTDSGLPTVIALGEQFERGPIEVDLGRITGFAGPPGQFLATFDVACQTAGVIGLVIIDGLNEATDRTMWGKYLGSFLADAAGRRHVRLVLSCRSEFLDETLPAALQRKLKAFTHQGFGEVTPEAVRQFVDFYGIERPSFPLLDPEFTNPLFLKLLCTTLHQRGEHRFPTTGVGTSWIYESFLDAINSRLAAAGRCDYDPARGLVHEAVDRIASAMYADGQRRLPKPDADALTSALLAGRPWSSGLLAGLLKEAVLSEVVIDNAHYVRFGYERLGDIAIAKLIAAKEVAEVKADVAPLAERWHLSAGILQALASIIPETHGVELIDVVGIDPEDHHYAAHTDFLLSLAWRQPSAVSERSINILRDLLRHPDFSDAAYNTLLQAAAIPGHTLNAHWLHEHLAAVGMADRDTTWSHFCDWQDDIDRPHLPSLIEWAWSDSIGTTDIEVRYLVAVALAWALSASHRPTRDNATKALIAMLELTPTLYVQLLQKFREVDDDYIEERLLAIGCGIAQRRTMPAAATTVGEAVCDFTLGRDYWPENLLSRDYARRAIEAAIHDGWESAIADIANRVRPPYQSVWTQTARSADEINRLSGLPGYPYREVSRTVMSEFDDFRKYVIDAAVRTFDLHGELNADDIGRMIFDRVLDLGWTPERFSAIDRHLPRPSSAERKKLEGYARKYVWIAYRQLTGRMTDRYRVRPRYTDDDTRGYDGPLDIYGHDIDPTMLLRRTVSRVYATSPMAWFSPIAGTFPAHVASDWTADDEHVPQVDKLLVTADDSGTRWAVLEGEYVWLQPQLPEDIAGEKPRHQTCVQIRSYLIDADDIDKWLRWAKPQNWAGRWMPESGSPAGLFLADHPYESDWPNLDGQTASFHGRGRPPGRLEVTTTRYGGMANEWDQSDSRYLYGLIPSTALCRHLGLQRLSDFRWGTTGGVKAANFSASELGPDTVHAATPTLSAALQARRKLLLWTIVAEKETITHEYSGPRDSEPISRTCTAAYIYDGLRITLVDAVSRTAHAGGIASRRTAWALPAEISP